MAGQSEFEVVVAIYKKGAEEPIQEETVLETDDWDEAQEEFEALAFEDEGDEEPAEVDVEQEVAD
jgi:hypothetical protein